MITVEEHNILIGLGSAVCEVTAELGRGIVRRNHNNSKGVIPVVSVYAGQYFKPIHFRHHDVQKQKGKICSLP